MATKKRKTARKVRRRGLGNVEGNPVVAAVNGAVHAAANGECGRAIERLVGAGVEAGQIDGPRERTAFRALDNGSKSILKLCKIKR